MFYHIKNAVQGEMIDTATTVEDGSRSTVEEGDSTTPQTPTVTSSPSSNVSETTQSTVIGEHSVGSPGEQVSHVEGGLKVCLDDMQEADRERALKEKIELRGMPMCGDTGPGLCHVTPYGEDNECDPNAWETESDATVIEEHDRVAYCDEGCRYDEGIYVLSENCKPMEYFQYKCVALKRMRDRAREMALIDPNYRYRVVHCSENKIQVVSTYRWSVLNYDEVHAEWSINRIYKKKYL